MTDQMKIMPQPQVVVVQPQRGQWQTNLCDCFNDPLLCLSGTFCFSCLGCQVAADMGECCICGGSKSMRVLYRTKYGIPGSLMNDCLIVLCCPYLALCQLKRDINKRRQLGIF